MEYFLLIWIGPHLLYPPDANPKFETKRDCQTAAVVAGNLASLLGDVTASCYDHNGTWVSTFGRGSAAAPAEASPL